MLSIESVTTSTAGKLPNSSSIEYPRVSVIVPCRNEAQFISACLDSILGNDYPKDCLEILIVDGMSEDSTRSIVSTYGRSHACIKILDNPKQHVTAAVNLGIKAATGEIIMIMGGAHATYAHNYISNCVNCLQTYDAENVGGIIVATPADETLVAKGIALVLSHPFGAGNSYFRIGSKRPRWVDTVFGGCYRKEVFEKLGLWNEELSRGSDMDFHIRLKRAGGRTLLVPDIVAYYYPKATLTAFAEHNFDDGFWAFYPLKFGKKIFSWRHMVPLAFIVSLIVSGLLAPFLQAFQTSLIGIRGTYIVANLVASLHVSWREHRCSYLVVLPVAFAIRHLAYGTGALVGLPIALTER
jgi:glycosyltransferase involved in cell wall biosynthesis